MAERKLRAGVVGCGGVAQAHLAAIRAMEDVDLVGACDIKISRAEAAAAGSAAVHAGSGAQSAASAQAYASLEDMLGKARLDVLHICTPHPLHAPMAERAAAHGVAVFTEKPPAVSRAQWQAFSRLAGKIPVGVCFQNRYNPETTRAMQRIASPEAGRVLGGRAFVTWNRDETYYRDSDWRGRWSTEGGGALINQAVHTLDLLVRFMGKPGSVSASMRCSKLRGVIEVEDTVEAYIDFDGAPGLFYATNAYCVDAPVMVEIACENLSVRLEPGVVRCRRADGRVLEESDFAQETPQVGKAYWGTGHARCIRDFYESVREGRTYMNDIDSVRDTMEALVAIYESAGLDAVRRP